MASDELSEKFTEPTKKRIENIINLIKKCSDYEKDENLTNCISNLENNLNDNENPNRVLVDSMNHLYRII